MAVVSSSLQLVLMHLLDCSSQNEELDKSENDRIRAEFGIQPYSKYLHQRTKKLTPPSISRETHRMMLARLNGDITRAQRTALTILLMVSSLENEETGNFFDRADDLLQVLNADAFRIANADKAIVNRIERLRSTINALRDLRQQLVNSGHGHAFKFAWTSMVWEYRSANFSAELDGPLYREVDLSLRQFYLAPGQVTAGPHVTVRKFQQHLHLSVMQQPVVANYDQLNRATKVQLRTLFRID